MDWEKALSRYGLLIEEKIGEYFSEVLDRASTYHPFIKHVYGTLKEFVLRKGKRLASYSTLLTYSGYTDTFDDRILTVCVGIELYRHCILLHDDLIDRDDFRRGKTTVHKMFSEKRDERFGEGIAVFLGDILYALAIEVLMSSGFEEDKLAEVLRTFSEGYREVNESQILDLLFEDKDVEADEWYVMASKRAASLFKVTMLVGAILGGATERDLRLLEEAATNIGYAFDIQDDIIDTYASEYQYGRSPCSDLVLGKKPLHIVYALGSKNRKESETLSMLLGKKPSMEEIELARLIIKDSGGLNASKERSKIHAEKAKTLIVDTSLNEESKEFFISFINYIEESLEWYK
ncbi:MAG: polyprenyl synthetase family protein [Candidatus Hodarchaeota archaeon]